MCSKNRPKPSQMGPNAGVGMGQPTGVLDTLCLPSRLIAVDRVNECWWHLERALLPVSCRQSRHFVLNLLIRNRLWMSAVPTTPNLTDIDADNLLC